jgi:hypothetical protein
LCIDPTRAGRSPSAPYGGFTPCGRFLFHFFYFRFPFSERFFFFFERFFLFFLSSHYPEKIEMDFQSLGGLQQQQQQGWKKNTD